MPRVNVKRAIENSNKLIKKNTRYDMTLNDINEIREMSRNDWECICNSFKFGYTQGYKAAMKLVSQGKEAG